ncbi:MAG: pyridoxal phosphate-dependent aminotransferase [Rhodanobacteraceae bacterium]|nr:MAG: pyridoxal phosphate-dependent aminotransferase [Rhodanobacteraceae bacterium]
MQIETKLPKVGTTIFTVMSQLAVEHKAVNLGQGFPDFETPANLRDALARAMSDGRNQYAPMSGIPKLREQIALLVERLYARRVSADTEVTVTSGATEAIFAAIACSVHTGDEVIVLDPCYDCYEPAIALAGGKAVHVPLSLPDFAVDWDRVRAAITPRTRLLMVNSPHNPSGAVFAEPDLDALAAIAVQHGLLVLSDEVYEHIVFDGRKHLSVSRRPALAERSFVISSFGKTWHCTGWKVGYCVAPKALTAEFRKVHQYLTFCTFHPAQCAFAEVMEHDPQHARELAGFYQAKCDQFRQLLAGSRFKLPAVHGGYFQLADYSAIRDIDDLNFCEWMVREAGVAAIPVSAFYETAPDSHLIRFCFAKSDATLEAAAERLCKI